MNDWIEANMVVVEGVANQMRRRYHCPIDEVDDIISEGYVALCEMAQLAWSAHSFEAGVVVYPETHEVVRKVRNAIAAYMMRSRRRTNKSRPIYDKEDFKEQEVDAVTRKIEELPLAERLAVKAYLRGVSYRDVESELGVSFARIGVLVKEVFN